MLDWLATGNYNLIVDSHPDASDVRHRIGQQIRNLLRLAPAVHAETARRVGVGVTDLLALDHITSAPKTLGAVELADLLDVRSASATVLIHRLVATGHVQRTPHPTDRRRIGLQANPSAYQNVRAALSPLIADITQITDHLGEHDANVVMKFLEEITTTLNDFTHKPKS